MAEKLSNPGGILLGVVIALSFLVLWGFISTSDSFEDLIKDYKTCVEDCVADSETCVFSEIVYDIKREAWLLYEDYNLCSSELESCISDCDLSNK